MPTSKRKKPLPRRTPLEIANAAGKVWDTLKRRGPQTSEQLTAVYKTTAERMGPIMRYLGSKKAIKAKGNTRATVYSAVGKRP